MPEIITTTSIGVGYAVGGSSPVEPPTLPPVTVHRPALSGRIADVHGLPVPHACVRVFGNALVFVEADALGYYQLDELPGPVPFAIGGWAVVAFVCGDEGQNPTYFDFGRQLNNAPAVVNITLYRTPTIRVRTYDENSQPLGVVCVVNTEPSTQASISVVLTRPDGTFGPLDSVQAGRYRLEVRPNCAAPAYPPQSPDGDTFEVREGTGGTVVLNVVTNGG